MAKGYAVIVLHAHLPYVLSHGRWPHGTDWLCEAACECYIPLLNAVGSLASQGKAVNLTVGVTPVLSEMLACPLFGSELVDYIEAKIGAASADRASFEAAGDKEMAALAASWQHFYASRYADFERYGGDLTAAFRRLQDEGLIELIVSAATHAYLPLLALDGSIDAQVGEGVASYRRHFRREPRGIWLPECAYRPERPASSGPDAARQRPGLEDFLFAHGLKYFFVDGRHVMASGGEGPYGEGGLLRAHPGRYTEGGQDRADEEPGEREIDIYAPHTTGPPGAKVSFFIRDTETSQQVWSARFGYPGDPAYLEFHKKRDPGGLRYWSVTDQGSDLGAKALYRPDDAAGRVREHAAHFARLVEERLGRYRAGKGRTGVLTLSFDAELFGHWWFEGVSWLSALVSAFDPNCVTIEKASTALECVNPLGDVRLPEGSWGEGGRHLLWYNKETAWTWRHLHGAEREMEAAVREDGDDAVSRRLLKQMARELLLAQSSDWQFLISTGTAGDYGESRFLGHYRAFEDLRAMLRRYGGRGVLPAADRKALSEIEKRDCLFDDVRLEWFKERKKDGL